MSNASTKSSSTKNNSKVAKGQARSKAVASVTRKAEAKARPTLEGLQAAASKLPQIIRPTYLEFDVPSGKEKVIIRKLPIGVRDTINEFADGDPGKYAGKMVQESLVYPQLTYAQIDEIDVEDFNVIHHYANELSYRKVGEVVKQFLDGQSKS